MTTPSSLDQQTDEIKTGTNPDTTPTETPESVSGKDGTRRSKTPSQTESSGWLGLGLRSLLRGGLAIVVVVGGGLSWLYTTTMGSSYIDNPTDREISVTIDETTYTIPADGSLEVSLPFGEKTVALAVDGEPRGTFVKGWFDGGSIINPTQSLYIRSNIIYQVDDTQIEKAEDAGKMARTTICLSGKQYDDYNMVFYTGTFLANDRDYSFLNPAPSEETIEGDYVIKTELLRQKNFMKAFDPEKLQDCK